MKMLRRLLLLAAVIGCTVWSYHALADGGQRAAKPRLDHGKSRVIEPAVKNVLNNTAPVAAAPARPGAATPRLDVGKGKIIEPALKGTLAGSPMSSGQPAPVGPPPAQPPVDVGKYVRIEPHLKAVVAAAAPAPVVKNDAFVNPKVEPGKVRWHAGYTDACAAAVRSKKPVLLFQLMGKLDDQFC